MLDTIDFIPADADLSTAEVEEMEATIAGCWPAQDEPHAGFLADLAAFEGMGR